jgi:L-fuconolactonase
LRIDAHHHLWQYTSAEYGWIDDSMHVLRRDFLPADLAEACAAAHVDVAVAVQARQTLEETHWLLSLAAKSPLIRGVVGWADIAADTFPSTLEALRVNEHLKGLRHVIQAEPDGFLDALGFNRGIETLTTTGLVYDILIFARQLEAATRFVDRHPTQTFVLDHIAKPSIAAGEIGNWAKNIRELARRPNVACKLSGMVTEADPTHWTPAQLHPYFEVALEAFTPERLMIGTDWPVCTLGITYAAWWQLVEEWIAPLTENERHQILGQTAARAYRLNLPRSW